MRRLLLVVLALLAFPLLAVVPPIATAGAVSALGRLAVAPTAPVAGELTGYTTRVPGVGRRVVLQRKSGARWVRVATARSAAGGRVTVHGRLTATSTVRAYATPATLGGKHYKAFRGPARTVRLAAQSGRMTIASSARTGAAIATQVAFVPSRSGRPVQVQRWTGSAWATAAAGVEGASGSAALSVVPPVTGTLTYRAVAGSWHGASAVASSSRTVQVSAACVTSCTTIPPTDPPAVPLPPGEWASIDAGAKHTCGIRSDGTAWCWGRNQYGQLGASVHLGTDTATPAPVQVGSATSWSRIAAGADHTCAVRTDGTAWCWGSNFTGQLSGAAGLGAVTPYPVPRQVGTDKTWSSLSAGTGYTCGVRRDATAWCWGDNYAGQLGSQVASRTSTPTQVAGSWKTVDAGAAHTCGVRTDGTAWCWGSNMYGQLGSSVNMLTVTANPAPVQVGGAVRTWASVSADGNHTCATRTDGTAWCWGSDYYGELGPAAPVTTESAHPDPVQVGAGGWASISANGLHTCGLRTDGQAQCWGHDFSGEVGTAATLGTHDAGPAAITVPGGAVWRSVSAGGSHSCAVRAADGTGWCWGSNQYGQLGDAATPASTTPNPTPLQVG